MLRSSSFRNSSSVRSIFTEISMHLS